MYKMLEVACAFPVMLKWAVEATFVHTALETSFILRVHFALYLTHIVPLVCLILYFQRSLKTHI